MYTVISFLESNGYSVWVDRDGIESGDAFKMKIVDAIEQSKCVLFFSSEASNSSEWTEKEINIAVEIKKEIIPIRLDKTVYNKSVRFDLSGKDFIDYSNVNFYESAKEKLLKSLRNKNVGKSKDEHGSLASLTFKSDSNCNLIMDGVKVGNLVSDTQKVIYVSLGEHNFVIQSLRFPSVNEKIRINIPSTSFSDTIDVFLKHLEKKVEAEDKESNVLWDGGFFFLSFTQLLLFVGYLVYSIIKYYNDDVVLNHPWWMTFGILVYLSGIFSFMGNKTVAGIIYIFSTLFVILCILNFDIYSYDINNWVINLICLPLLLLLFSLFTKSGRKEFKKLINNTK